MFTTALTLALLPIVALASPQYGGGYGAPAGGGSTTTSAAAPSITVPANSQGHISVTVGASGLSFDPQNITAQVGDIVSFYFTTATKHSVTQSTFADPCTPLTTNGTGFDSGLTSQSVFSINVTDTSKPIWFFCKFPSHCGSGMVGSINAPSSGNDYPTFLNKAKSLGSSAPTVSDSGAVTGGVGALATAAPSSAGAAPAPTTSGKSGAGRVIVNGGLALVAVAAAVALAA